MTRPIASKLHVVTALFNPRRYQSHIRNQKRFIAHILEQPEVHLTTIEMAYAGRHFEIEEVHERHTHITVRGTSEIWLKEALLNLAVQRLPPDWEYVAWVDGDLTFHRPDWAYQTLHMLQHHAVVQPWSDCLNTGPEVQGLDHHKSFCRQYVRGEPRVITSEGYGGGPVTKPGAFWHPGFAWAMTREAWDTVGGLLDIAVVGSGDHHMALGLIQEAERSMPGGIHPAYRRSVLAWQERATALYRNIGYVEGTILHHWHGRRVNRRYKERWEILVKHQFDPDHDLRRNSMGVYELAPERWELRDAIRAYFAQRMDDANTID